jgi:hypothetical protein
MDHLHADVDAVITDLAADYSRAPGSILTEDDLKCLLVHRLLQIPELSEPRQTLDGLLGATIHCEVSWFDSDGRLRIKPDITILDPARLSLFKSVRRGYPLPTKGFSFGGTAIIFELKFIRSRKGVTTAATRSIRNDVEKIVGLFRKLKAEDAGNDLFCYFVVFSKVDRRVPEFDQLVNGAVPHPRCKIVFASAGVAWPRRPARGAAK